MKYSFSSDYNEVCCQQILDRMQEIYGKQFGGYSIDEINDSAKLKIKNEIKRECDIHFLVGGTQANATVIAAALKPWQAVVAVESGHINVHETGAIEATGHKVLTVKADNGKMLPERLEQIILAHPDEHMVQPKMVYISNSTEIGTIYTKNDLLSIRKVCDKYGLYLFLDGARLGAALMSKENDLTLSDLADICDVFYIGATKNGGMIGEAVVITNDNLKNDFRYITKQKGGLLAKGFILGVQFEVLFTDGLFFKLAEKADGSAQYLQNALMELGVKMDPISSTNQIFPVFSNEVVAKLENDYSFNVWSANEKESTIRLVTNFNADEEKIKTFICDVKELIK